MANDSLSEILWLVTARSGSKSIPDKNIRVLGKMPLMGYRIVSALKIAPKENVWLSTDSEKYASIGESLGATVPFIRPAHLASDGASSMDVVLHAMEHAENSNKEFKYIGLLEPTCPFIESSMLTNALQQLENNTDADAIVAVKEVRPNSYFVQNESRYLDEVARNMKNRHDLSRQSFKKQVTPSGGFYISRWDAFKQHKTFYTEKTLTFEVPTIASLEIDEPMDWEWAAFILEKDFFEVK